MKRLLVVLFLAFGCGPEVDDVSIDAGPAMPTNGEDPRCPNRIVPSEDCRIERLDCPLNDGNGLRCMCLSDEWRCF